MRIAAVLLMMLAGPATAQDYGNWHVQVVIASIVPDRGKICSAATKDDIFPSVAVTFARGGAGPPGFLLSFIAWDNAPYDHRSPLQDGHPAYIHFDDEQVMDGIISVSVTEEGFTHSRILIDHPLNQRVLDLMHTHDQMDLVVDGRVFQSTDLAGFPTAYQKAAEACGFGPASALK